jgi:hypothetical protein
MYRELERKNQKLLQQLEAMERKTAGHSEEVAELRAIIKEHKDTILKQTVYLNAEYEQKTADIRISERGKIEIELTGPWTQRDAGKLHRPLVLKIDELGRAVRKQRKMDIPEEELKEQQNGRVDKRTGTVVGATTGN